MLVAVADETYLPEWLYPNRLAPLSGEAMRTGQLVAGDLDHLWLALDPNAEPSAGFEILVSTHCDVGFSHGALESVPRLGPTFVAALARLTDSERWQVALVDRHYRGDG